MAAPQAIFRGGSTTGTFGQLRRCDIFCNSGGALVDEHGNVIGIVAAKPDAAAALAMSGNGAGQG